mgnify:CR=1 FL=1
MKNPPETKNVTWIPLAPPNHRDRSLADIIKQAEKDVVAMVRVPTAILYDQSTFEDNPNGCQPIDAPK